MDLVERTADAKQSGARFDVVVIGAGQAGLAMGHCLARQGRRFVILDAADSMAPPGGAVGPRWCCSRRNGTTACPGSRLRVIPTAIRRATR